MLRGQHVSPRTFWITVAIFCAIAITAVSAFAFEAPFFHPEFNHWKPPVSWNPNAVQLTVSAGDTTNVAVTLTPSVNLKNVSFDVSRRLRQFVQISPTNLPSVTKGVPVTMNISAHAAATTSPKVVWGAICVTANNTSSSKCGLDDDDDARSVALPLFVRVKITWNMFTNTNAGVQMSYPNLGEASKVEVSSPDPGETRFDVKFQSSPSADFVNGFGVFLIQNSNHLNLSDWFRQNIDPQGVLMSSGAFTPRRLANGMNVLVLSGAIPSDYLDQFGPVNSIYGISPSGNTIVSIVQSQVNEFDLYGLTNEQIDQMLLQVASNLQVP